jgi:fatty acid-binding protein DegV
MKKENKEMLKTIISNQLLIMKALKIEPVREVEKVQPKKITPAKKAPAKKAATRVIKK